MQAQASSCLQLNFCKCTSKSGRVCLSSALYLGITSGAGLDILGVNPAYSASRVLP